MHLAPETYTKLALTADDENVELVCAGIAGDSDRGVAVVRTPAETADDDTFTVWHWSIEPQSKWPSDFRSLPFNDHGIKIKPIQYARGVRLNGDLEQALYVFARNIDRTHTRLRNRPLENLAALGRRLRGAA